MQDERESKPPITIAELEARKKPSDGEEAAKQGPLSFAGTAKSKNNGNGDSGGGDGDGGGKKKRFSLGGKPGNTMQMVLPAFIAVVLAAAMLFMFAPSKADVNELSGRLDNVDNLSKAVTAAHTRIDDFINNNGGAPDLSGYAKTTDLTNYAKAGQLDVLSDKIDMLLDIVGGNGNVTPGVTPTPTPTPTSVPTVTPTPVPTVTPTGGLTSTIECVTNCPSSTGATLYGVTVVNSGEFDVAGSLVLTFEAFSHDTTVNTSETTLSASSLEFTLTAVPKEVTGTEVSKNCIRLVYTSSERTFFRGSTSFVVYFTPAYVGGSSTIWAASAKIIE